MRWIPSLHPRDLLGRFRRKRGGPQKAKLSNRVNPVKRAEKVVERVARSEGKKFRIAARDVYYHGSVTGGRQRP